ncbi:MAG: hypothetical protein Q8S03_16805 [Brevundimonas sp.]|uniref:hypothetical protein n=1 Tax=Brevundimonas sp. TaxID=1871086 RepID=UPI002735DBC0|nr:hypothetical protein [Brevundimonas sp.]MDP3406352.1 hypothetical protein [Brevundimonas sp.]
MNTPSPFAPCTRDLCIKASLHRPDSGLANAVPGGATGYVALCFKLDSRKSPNFRNVAGMTGVSHLVHLFMRDIRHPGLIGHAERSAR